MWSNGFSITLEIRRGWSPLLLLLVLAPLPAAALALALANLPAGLSWAGLLGTLREAWHATPWWPGFVHRLQVDPTGRIRLWNRRGEGLPAALAGAWIFPGGHLVGLDLRGPGGRSRVVLLRADFPPDLFRRLLVRIRRRADDLN